MMRASHDRHGFSLLEVILALAILAASTAVLGRLVRLGIFAAGAAQDEPHAMQWCESRLEELALGIRPLTSQSDVPLPEDDEWTFAIDVQPTDLAGLLQVRCTVRRLETASRSHQVSLDRWIIDPTDPRWIPVEPETESGTTSSGSGGSTP